jgi:phospholipid/cholesterol/gamma-HCH transport system ATP-binding protein
MTSETPGALIEIAGLCYSVGGHPVFSGLDIAIPRGRITAIMGPSGTGKTTLLRLITGQIRADAGRITVDGEDVGMLSERELQRLRLRMGFLFQEGALFTDSNVFDNVAFPLREHTDLPESLIRHVVLTKLHSVGLRGAAPLMPSELSGGMARRVALARAIVMEPAMLFCDEPFTGLDPISIGVVARLIRQMNEALGITSVVVSHDVDEMMHLADAIFVLADGRVIAAGNPAELKRSRSELVQQFIRGVPDGPVPFHYPAPDYERQLLDMGAD